MTQSKFVIIYMCSDDLYSEEFETQEEADAWMSADENETYKCYVIKAEGCFNAPLVLTVTPNT